MAYEQIEPFGDRRGDIQAGIVAATMANIHRAKNTEAFSPSDFIPDWTVKSSQPQMQSLKDQENFFDILTIKQNALVEARKQRDGSNQG